MLRAWSRVFDYSGRSSRWEYWSFFIGFAVVLLLTGAWVANYQDTHFGLYPAISDDDAGGVALVVIIFLVAPALSLKVRRFHDFGWSGWAVLWMFVPVANLVIECMLLFRDPAPQAAQLAAENAPSQIAIYHSSGTAAAHAGTDVDHIAKLADLHASGMLTAQEFAAAKARLLRR